ncbi:hypothetical protein HSX11_23555 [Oxalobacteraceae bacterium]|nr:hypothetical protein [Oxalobacteraceae bacterium]
MFHFAEHLTLASKALIDAQLAGFHAFSLAFANSPLADAAFDGGLALVERNVEAFRGSLAGNTVVARQLLAPIAGSLR